MADHEIRLDIEATKKGRGLEQTASEAKQLETTIRDLRQELERSEKKFEDAKAVSIALKSEYKTLKASGEGTKEMFLSLSKQISKAEERELSAISATRKLAAEIKDTGDESIATSDDLADLNKRLQESEGYITGVGGKAALQAQKMDEMRQSTDRAGDELAQLGDKADSANNSLKRVGDGVDAAGNSLDTIQKKVGVAAYAMGNILADGLRDAAQAAKQFAVDSYESFRSFDEESRRVFAQTPGLSANMRDNLSKDAMVIASQIGRLPEEVLPALRKALNLGISEDNLLSSIETASMAARIGGESLIDTMVLGQSVVNAYGGELYSLSDTYDYLNYITQSSGLEFADLNGQMNEIISAAAEAGIGLDSVAGAMITMNRQGDDANEIAGLLSNVLTQISIEGTALGAAFEEAAGVGFRQFTAAGGTLTEGLTILQQHANDTGQDLLNMVGGSSPFYRDVQAARGVLELTGKHAADLAENTALAAQATGTLAEAAKEFEGGAALSYDKAAASVGNLKLATGEWLAQMAESIGLINNANQMAQLLSGTLEHQVDKQTQSIVEQARATGDYEAALKRLSDGFNAGGAAGQIFNLTEGIEADTETLIREMARVSSSYEDFQNRLAAANVNAFANSANLNDFSFNPAQLFDQEKTKAITEYYQALSEIDYWQSKIPSSAAKAGNSVQQFYADQAAGLFLVEESESRLLLTEAELAARQAEYEASVLVRTESLARQAEYTEWLTTSTADYFNEISNGTGAQLEFNDIVYETALQYGATAEQQALLKYGMGELTKEALLQQLGLAAAQTAAAELGRQYAEGTITLGQLKEGLTALTEGSPYESVYELDSGDSLARVVGLKSGLDALNGRRTSSTHTHTVITVEKTVKDSDKDGQPNDYQPPSPPGEQQYSGGDMFPGRAYLVGDTPGGGTTPYSEIIVPQQHMVNLGVQGSKGFMGKQGGISVENINITIGGGVPSPQAAGRQIASALINELGKLT